MEGRGKQSELDSNIPPVMTRRLKRLILLATKAYGAKDYLDANRLYSLGISQHATDPDAHLLYLNRCAFNMALERYPAAMTDVDTGLDLVQHKLQFCGLALQEYDATIKWDEKARLRRAKCF